MNQVSNHPTNNQEQHTVARPHKNPAIIYTDVKRGKSIVVVYSKWDNHAIDAIRTSDEFWADIENRNKAFSHVYVVDTVHSADACHKYEAIIQHMEDVKVNFRTARLHLESLLESFKQLLTNNDTNQENID